MARERFFLELDPPGTLPREAPHVVIVGGGFAGLKAAHALAGSDVRVTLIDRRNFNLFQPLLYQVATGLVSESDVASPLRQLVGRAPNVQVLMGEVDDLDPAAREVVFNDRRYRYDHLILAAGATSSFFGHDDWRQQAIAMKTLADAEAIQRHVLSALEEAEQTPDAQRRELLQSVVVIGGGPTGCELAASLIDLMRHTLAREFKQLDPAKCRVTLVDPGDRVLRAMDPELSAAAGDRLKQIGVELLLGGRVKAIEERLVRLSVGEAEQTLAAGTICWTAGVAPSGLGRLLAERTGCPLDKGGRVEVAPDFSVPGHPEIRVVGDLCTYSHTANGKPLPGMAGPAVQMGTWVARDILERSQGREHRPFRFVDFGTMAVIGPWFAVADLRGLKVSGAFGFLLWALAHLAFMPARENRLILLTKWLWMIVVRQRSALVISEPVAAGVPAPVTPGS